MKLVELLARELDVWPDQAEWVVQEGDKELYCAWDDKPYHGGGAAWRDGADGDGMYFESQNPTLLASDWKTTIITRADWQAERERIDGKAAGEQQQPQQEREEMTPCEKLGYKVGDLFVVTENSWFEGGDEIRLTDDDGTECPRFERVDCTRNGFESFSYIRKITDQPTVTVNIETQNTDDPRTMRNRILEIDRTTEALEEERGQLVQRLADEGFSLLPVLGHSDPAEDMSDWRNWMAGDLVECVSGPSRHDGYYTAGTVYAVGEVDINDVGFGLEVDVMCNRGFTLWCPASCFKFHSRPTA